MIIDGVEVYIFRIVLSGVGQHHYTARHVLFTLHVDITDQ